MKIRLLLLVAASLLALAAVSMAPVLAQTKPAQKQTINVSGGALRPDQACFDVQHYRLELAVDPAQQSIAGSLTMTAKATSDVAKLSLDLDNHLIVSSLEVDGKAATFEHKHGRIQIEPAEPIASEQSFTVTVHYGGKPVVARNPPWTGGFTWSQTKDGQPWIATTCQGEGADLWWPCKDHPSDKPESFDLICTVPDGLVLASNGTMQGEPVSKGGKTTFHWRSASPIANYNIALNIAPYTVLEQTFECIDGTKMPVRFYVLPSSKRKALRCMTQFLDHITVFEALLGPYPFRHEKYGLAETPHLGMEHQTIIAYGNGFQDPQYDWLHNHELAHEWWGNLVTCRDWKDMWLHEGFGTYMQPLYREVRFGHKEYLKEINRHRTFNRKPIAPRESKNSKQIYFGGGAGNDIYYKGSWVLHTLRWQLGDKKFFEVLRRFSYPNNAAEAKTDGSQVRFVDTEDLVALCSEVSGEDMSWFFEVYVRSAGLPRLQWSFVDGLLSMEWQTPHDLPFSLSVPLILNGKEVVVRMPNGKAELRVGVSDYEIDPNQRVLMAKPELK